MVTYSLMSESNVLPEAQAKMQQLLGHRFICTLIDGRRVTGTFVCMDRLKNIIMCDCVEQRTIDSNDYLPSENPVKKEVTRRLQQAMVPGDKLVKVEVIKERQRLF